MTTTTQTPAQPAQRVTYSFPPRTFTGRSEYRRELQAAKTKAVQALRIRTRGAVLPEQVLRATRDRVQAAWLEAYGPLQNITPLDSIKQNAAGRVVAPLPEGVAPTAGEPTPAKPKPAPFAEAPAPDAEEIPADPGAIHDAPAGARVVVQCADGCGEWLPAHSGRAVVKRTAQHQREHDKQQRALAEARRWPEQVASR